MSIVNWILLGFMSVTFFIFSLNAEEVNFYGEKVENLLTQNTEKFVEHLVKNAGLKVKKNWGAWKRVLELVGNDQTTSQVDIFAYDLCSAPKEMDPFPGYENVSYKRKDLCIPTNTFEIITFQKELTEYDMPISDKKHWLHLEKFKNLNLRTGQEMDYFIGSVAGIDPKRFKTVVDFKQLIPILMDGRADVIFVQKAVMYGGLNEILKSGRIKKEIYYRPINLGFNVDVGISLNRKGKNFQKLKMAYDNMSTKEFRQFFLEVYLLEELGNPNGGSLTKLIENVRAQIK